MKSNEEITDFIRELKIAGSKRKLWKDIAAKLERSRANWAEVNVGHISKNLRAGEVALVPGKVLGNGKVNESFRIAAISFSDSAYEKLLKSGCEAVTIKELLSNNPDVKNVRIIG